jgi:hypothetical protein
MLGPSLTQLGHQAQAESLYSFLAQSATRDQPRETFNCLILNSDPKIFRSTNWVWAGSAPNLSRKCHKSHQIAFLSGSAFRLIFMIF